MQDCFFFIIHLLESTFSNMGVKKQHKLVYDLYEYVKQQL